MPKVAGATRAVWGNHSSGDEDEGAGRGQGAQVSEQVFEKYLTELDTGVDRDDPLFERGMGKVREYLASTTTDRSACLICLGTIKPSEAVWSCQASCYAILHMTCMQEWARSQIEQCVLKTMNRLSQFPGAAAEARATAEWGCPKCRHPYPSSAVPRTYTCFCGKVVDPEWDPWRTAHSCGELCGRKLAVQAAEGPGSGGCQHTCLLLCHPGPCPPCPLVVQARCHCGKRVERRRCGHHEFSCGAPCGARLPCGHSCPEPCHDGPCQPCGVAVKAICQCGAETRQLPCHQKQFHCTRVCGKPLSCNNHTCPRTCHSGACGVCPDQGTRTCPCGHTTYTDLPCTERAPTCGGTCGKTLLCGQHTCPDRCHTGDCSSCRSIVTKTCRCGKLQKELPCAQELLCDRRCNAMRACGRHPCKRRCCPGGDACPPCEEVCGRKLRCGNHRCPAPCHSGPCRPCPLTVSFSCACGRTTMSLPCGAEQRAFPPVCRAQCMVPALCRHAPAPPHRCHYGPCPPCRLPCGTQLLCGHTCGSATCHDPTPPAIVPFTPPTAPKIHLTADSMSDNLGNGFGALEAPSRVARNRAASNGGAAGAGTKPGQPAATAAAAQAQSDLQARGQKLPSSCPPCQVPVVVSCLGGHEQMETPCKDAAPYQCRAPCGRALACGNHTCRLPCHVTAAAPGATATPCESCTQACGRQRPCGHPCSLPCHADACPPCRAAVRTACHCGRATLSLSCDTLTAASASGAGTPGADVRCCGKPCHKPLPQCPHPCRVQCHAGPCPGAVRCEEEVTVRCACKHLRAKWPCHQVSAALAAAGRPAMYDDTTPLRLLPCGSDCPPGPSTDAAKDRGISSTPAAASQPPPAKSAQPAAAQAAAPAPKVRLSKAEREAEAARREQERLQRVARERRLQQLKTALVWLVILTIGVILGVYLNRVVTTEGLQ